MFIYKQISISSFIWKLCAGYHTVSRPQALHSLMILIKMRNATKTFSLAKTSQVNSLKYYIEFHCVKTKTETESEKII